MAIFLQFPFRKCHYLGAKQEHCQALSKCQGDLGSFGLQFTSCYRKTGVPKKYRYTNKHQSTLCIWLEIIRGWDASCLSEQSVEYWEECACCIFKIRRFGRGIKHLLRMLLLLIVWGSGRLSKTPSRLNTCKEGKGRKMREEIRIETVHLRLRGSSCESPSFSATFTIGIQEMF